jgi:hypothetical protein
MEKGREMEGLLVCVCVQRASLQKSQVRNLSMSGLMTSSSHTHTHSRGVTTILHSHIVLLLYRQRVKVSSSSLFTLKMYTATIFVITLFRDDDETLNLPVVDECDV